MLSFLEEALFENVEPWMIIVGLLAICLVLYLIASYIKAPPDMAYIVSGARKKSKVVIGRAALRFPFFQRLDKLNLRLIPILSL